MSWRKGPGEGFHAAKNDALVLDPTLKCRGVYYRNYNGARRELVGYVVEDQTGKTIGKGKLSRDAWGEAVLKLKKCAGPAPNREGEK